MFAGDVGLNPIIYVLTRTSGRKNFFHLNYLSVKEQDYPNVVHYVSYDDSETGEYVKPYNESVDSENNCQFNSCQVSKIRKYGNGHFPYNLYLNHMLSLIEKSKQPGWIMILDDDDLFTSHQSLSQIVKTIRDKRVDPLKHFLMWQVEFPNERLVPRRTGGRTLPRLGEISMIGFMFHSQLINKLKFEDRKGGDYLMAKHLWSFLKPIWIPKVLTKINYLNIRRSGSGRRFQPSKIKNINCFGRIKYRCPNVTFPLSKKHLF